MNKPPKAAARLADKGWVLMERGRPDQALQQFQRAVQAGPGEFSAHHGLATARQALGDAAGAVDAFERALSVAPGNADTLIALGNLARSLDAPEQAAGFFREAALTGSGSVPAQAGLAHALRDLGRQEKAVDMLQSAIQVQPEAGPLWTALGAVMADLEDHANAETFLKEALRLDPKDGAAAGNLAEVLFAEGRPDEAAEAYAGALRLRPRDAALRFNHSLFALARGDLASGWRDYEARLDSAYPKHVRRDLRLRRWDGRRLPEGRLLVLAEQGVGDELHFLHCLPDTVARAGEVWWECDPRLTALLQRSFPEVRFVPWQKSDRPGIHRGYDWLADAPKFDACIEAGSLQTMFRTTLEAFPAGPPLLEPEPAAQRGDGGLRVGISWTSTRRNRLRDRGYVPLEFWGPLFAVPGVRWVNVQYGDVADEIAEAEARFGISIERTPGLDLKDDFEGTATLMADLDVVIGPTNAARQLAASCGVPTLVFSRLPYEFALGQPLNPFFPGMRDFVRLPSRDWGGAVDAVAAEIVQLAAAQAAA
ncbi:MAG: tetratricopeptide repeat protein [Minwuia sp.]|uniref:tetratricopeptide repeat protein n=1 Tax=Minwuia sp. TaxID=2493630 RepID=UPI003A8B9C4C